MCAPACLERLKNMINFLNDKFCDYYHVKLLLMFKILHKYCLSNMRAICLQTREREEGSK